ncbi:MAG: type I-G CRISPR-associated helicase/endonuclease Cas3g [Thermoplasmata archaeon]
MNLEDFKSFFERIHNYNPFPWQLRLLREVVDNGWPEVVNLPTSSGKTAIIDVAVFLLALEANGNQGIKRSRRRIFFVIDRRVVVDEAYERAEKIRKALENANDGILLEVAEALKKINYGDPETPLEVIKLRGGLPREPPFLKNPMQPAVIVSTVDQVGSRLLFRGYGVSGSMRPVHASLVGVDSLIIIDEAHISRPFEETLNRIRMFQTEKWSRVKIAEPITVVRMSATPYILKEMKSFGLQDEDLQDEVLKKRLSSSKIAKLVEVKKIPESMAEANEKISEKLKEEAMSVMEKLGKERNPVIGVVANSVIVARKTFEKIRKQINDSSADAVLLTGRIRPYDRDILMNEYLPMIIAGRERAVNSKPLLVVATQTIEVGADIDFDALVTENAPLDVLQQRFGRLNRLGLRDDSIGVIVNGKISKVDKNKVHPIYGESPEKTWDILLKLSEKRKKDSYVDMGASLREKIQNMGRKMIEGAVSPSSDAPILTPSQMDMLVQTFPTPFTEPSIPLYLHGIKAGDEDVQVIWRADLPEINEKNEADIIETVESLPPVNAEAMSLPIWALSSFSGIIPEDVADIEGVSGENGIKGDEIKVLKWMGPDESKVIKLSQVMPGDTIIVPSYYGRYDRYGWNPESSDDVEDVAEEAMLEKGKIVLRINENLVHKWFPPDKEEEVESARSLVENAMERYGNEEDLTEICEELIDSLLEIPYMKNTVKDALTKLKTEREEYVYPDDEKPNGIIIERRSLDDATEEDDTSSLTAEMELENHSTMVANMAREFATLAGIPDHAIRNIEISAKLHDIGKADPRFQAWLAGGDPGYVEKGRLLAKSREIYANDYNAIRMARVNAGYPAGARHECYSVAMIVENQNLAKDASDRELVKYLVGTHHGRGRAVMPAVDDNGMEEVKFSFNGTEVRFKGKHNLERLDSGWTELFWEITRKYGYWGTAYLETIVRLADHICSKPREVK